MIKPVGSSPVTQTQHPSPAHGGKLPEWAKDLSKWVKKLGGNLDRFQQLGPHGADDTTPKGKQLLAAMPKGVQDFWGQVRSALPDDDGTGAVLKIPLKDVAPNLKGNAYAVRWTSEDTKLDRLWVFDDKGKQIAKGWTDSGGAMSWEPAKKPFAVDDSPHS